MAIIDTSLGSFEKDVLEASHQQPVLVDFWADWCSPCLVIAPILEKIVNELEGAVHLAKLEVDDGENMKLAGRYRVRGFPTIMLFNKGEPIGHFSGARSKTWVLQFIEEHLNQSLS